MIDSFAIKNMDKKEEMFALVEQWRGSGLTRRAFAQQCGMSEASFKYWCKRQFNEVVKANRAPAAAHVPLAAMPSFIELAARLDMGAPEPPVRMEIELPGGARIKIY
jgi:hypothetical protein